MSAVMSTSKPFESKEFADQAAAAASNRIAALQREMGSMTMGNATGETWRLAQGLLRIAEQDLRVVNEAQSSFAPR